LRCAESGALRKVEPRQKEVESLETGATRWSQSVKAANACRETPRCGECRARHEELGGRLPPGIGAVQDPGTDVDALVEECAELHKAADGAHQVPNYGEAPVVSLLDVAVESVTQRITRDGVGEAETKGDTMSEPSDSKPSVHERGTLGNDDDNNDNECSGDQAVGLGLQICCQDSREHWHIDNMLSSQQFSSAPCAQLPSGRSAGMAGCVSMCVCAVVCVCVCVCE